MTEKTRIKTLKDVVVRFSGDSGDGMQLTGTIFADLSAVFGNTISTFPDYPAEIRAPQGTLSGVSGFQVRIGSDNVCSPGELTDVLVAMNPAALKVDKDLLKSNSIIIIDSDSFGARDLEKAEFKTDDYMKELGLTKQELFSIPISTLVKESSKEFGLDSKAALRSKNMFALGFVCWLFDRPMAHAKKFLQRKFASKETIRNANIKALLDGYNYGNNTHSSATIYRIEGREQEPGLYMDVNGNKATAFGLVAAAEKAGLKLFLGSYPITPATDILHELAKLKALGVKTMQAEDEIAGICTSIGASFAGHLAVTTTSGPGLALKSEAMGLAVMAELPLVIVDVQRGGPSTGLPTKSEQTDLLQALYGRNGESPMPIVSGITPIGCFDAAYWASKIALEHMTPVILLTDAFVANGSSAWKLPDLESYPSIEAPFVNKFEGEEPWKPYVRNEENKVRYWAIPGQEGYMHRLGGLEKNYHTGAISNNPENHQLMVDTRQAKVDAIAEKLPLQEVLGDEDAKTLIVSWGGTYGHIYDAVDEIRESGKKIAMAHFCFINPLPKNTADIMSRYDKVLVVEQNNGQFAQYLRSKLPNFTPLQYNTVTGQPLVVSELVEHFTRIMEE